MRKLMMLTVGAALLTASAALAQSSIDAPNGGRQTGREMGPASRHVRAAPHAASTRVSSGRKRSGESCNQLPTTGHEPGAPAPGRAAASPPANGAVDHHASPATGCAPQHRS